jgi:hypothetical protein
MSGERYEVRAQRQDGTERLYQAYADWKRAHDVCAGLRRVGYAARVVDIETGEASFDAATPVRLGQQ